MHSIQKRFQFLKRKVVTHGQYSDTTSTTTTTKCTNDNTRTTATQCARKREKKGEIRAHDKTNNKHRSYHKLLGTSAPNQTNLILIVAMRAVLTQEKKQVSKPYRNYQFLPQYSNSLKIKIKTVTILVKLLNNCNRNC